MAQIMEIMKTDTFVLIQAILVFVLLIAFISTLIKMGKINKKYSQFLKKLGNGQNIDEDLETYMYRVEKVEKQNAEVISYVKNLDKDLENCIQKIGIVRYNAFKDTGSDLSFALAMLDENNNGVVLNGIYSREMSNIYAKPVENGKSSYTISEEEKQAIQKAVNSKEKIKI